MADKGDGFQVGQATLLKQIAAQRANQHGYVLDILHAEQLRAKALANFAAAEKAIAELEVSLEASRKEFGAIDVDGILAAARAEEADRAKAHTIK